MGTGANSSDNHQEQPLTNNPAIAALEGFSQESSSSLSVEQLDTNSSHSGPVPVDNMLSSPTLSPPRSLPMRDASDSSGDNSPLTGTPPLQPAILINSVNNSLSNNSSSPSITPEKPKRDDNMAEYEAIELGRLPPSLQPQTKESQTTDHSIQIIPEDGSSITRSRATTNPVSEPLALFLKQMNISSDDFDSFELGMLNIIFSPKTWQQRVPTWVSLPSVSSLITKVAFYLSIRVQDLAAPGTTVANGTNITKHLSITGQAIPLYNQQAITRAYRINGFSNTISWVGSLWLLLYLSLQINAFILAVHDGQTDYSFRDIFFEPFDLSKLFTGSSQSTKASLANSVSSYYVWPFLIAIPLVAGVFSGWRYGKMAQSTNADSLELDIKQLKEYSPSARLDYWRWYLPKHPLSGPLKRISLYLRYQANIPDDAREKIFTTLVEFSAKAKGHTQLRAREVIASLTFAINPQDLVKAKAIFPDLDYTQTIKTMGKAYSNLNSAAFSLKPNDHENQLDALLRAGKTRYITHEQQLGYAGSFLALFILYDFYVSYGDLSLALIVLKGLINAFKNIDEMLKCKQANKVWSWRKESKIYVCSVCGDELQVAYRDIWTQETCVTAFMARTQPAQKIINFFQKHNLQGVTSLDFSAQLKADYTVYHTAAELDAIFAVINQQLPKLNNFIFISDSTAYSFTPLPNSFYAGAPLGRFLAKASQLKTINLSYLCLQNGSISLISSLANSTITTLNLYGNLIGDDGVAALINTMQYLPNLQTININDCESSDLPVVDFVEACLKLPGLTNITYGSTYITDDSAAPLAQLLQKPNLRTFSIYGGTYTDKALQSFAAQLPYAKNLTSLSLEYWSMTNQSTIEALTDALNQLPLQYLRLLGQNVEPTVAGMAYFFAHLNRLPRLQELTLAASTCPDEDNAAAFEATFPSSAINNLKILYCYNPALSINATTKIMSGLAKSNLTALYIKATDLSNTQAAHMQHLLNAPKLNQLYFRQNGFDETVSLNLVKQLPHSAVTIFEIYDNGITSPVVDTLADLVLKTKLILIGIMGGGESSIRRLFKQATQLGSPVRKLAFISDQINDDTAEMIAKNLPNTALTEFTLKNTNISDQGVQAIAKALIRPTKYQPLWLDRLVQNNQDTIESATQLTTLNLVDSKMTISGAQALYNNLPYTNIAITNLSLPGPHVSSEQLAELRFTSAASRSATIPWPVQLSYALLFTLPQQTWTSARRFIYANEYQDPSANSFKTLFTTCLFLLLTYKFFNASLKKISCSNVCFGLFTQPRNHHDSFLSLPTNNESLDYK
ncbi:MAG: hypothetical protein ACOVQX_07025 [Legionella sp.]